MEVSKLGFDFQIRALSGLARTLWLTGNYARAVAIAEETIAKARDSGNAAIHCIALIWAGSIHVWARSVDRLHEITETLEQVATRHSLLPYLNVAHITRGQLLIARGRPAEGVERIRTALETLHACKYEMVTTVSLGIMARGLSDMSLHAAALGTCDEVENLTRMGGDFLRLPELLATRGYCLAAAGQADLSERSYLAAIELARSQGVKSGQLRAAVSLAQEWIRVGRKEDAGRLLTPLVAAAGGEISLDVTLALELLG